MLSKLSFSSLSNSTAFYHHFTFIASSETPPINFYLYPLPINCHSTSTASCPHHFESITCSFSQVTSFLSFTPKAAFLSPLQTNCRFSIFNSQWISLNDSVFQCSLILRLSPNRTKQLFQKVVDTVSHSLGSLIRYSVFLVWLKPHVNLVTSLSLRLESACLQAYSRCRQRVQQLWVSLPLSLFASVRLSPNNYVLIQMTGVSSSILAPSEDSFEGAF